MNRHFGIWVVVLQFITGNVLAQDKTLIDYNRQIRPILSDFCFACHGPDEQQRKAKLRLDVQEGVFGKLKSGGHAVVPGKPADSVLLQRILTDDPTEQMPPPRLKKFLSPAQKSLLKQWIESGAPFAQHWAFVAPKRPALPKVVNEKWARNGIDYFILNQLEKSGWKPSAEADRVTLLRRLTFDLTGLPPTPVEIDNFLNDKRPDAYEQLVDWLFKSPHYGERMAVDWLDASRFADTHGYHIDAGRDMTRWREYVIDAFQNNLPFNRFTIEQLAGDLLPNATLAQKVASGFNRNHMINFEGGAIPEEYHNAYIVDRVNTTGTVWLGLTLTCAQCHDHKYDPISQKEFYRLYAFFNNVPESGLDGSRGNAAPMIKSPTRDQEALLDKLDREIRDLEKKLSQTPQADLDARQTTWEKDAISQKVIGWSLLDPQKFSSKGGAKLTKQPGGSILASGTNPGQETYYLEGNFDLAHLTGLRLEILPHDSFAAQGPGRSVNGNMVMTGIQTKVNGAPVQWQKASASFSQKEYPVSNLLSGNQGWAIHPEVGKPHSMVLSLAKPLALKEKASVQISLEFHSMFAGHHPGHFRLALTDAADPHGKDSMPPNILAILQTNSEKRSDQQKAELRTYFRNEVANDATGFKSQIAQMKQKKAEIEKAFPSTMVMQEQPNIRATHVLMRGEYNKKGEPVTAGVPAFLPAIPQGEPINRLGFARWLVDPKQPLTSRVIVNRYWQLFFGTGIVKSAEDFGSQSELPSHPELLDWLAVELQKSTAAPLGMGSNQEWSVRDLIRLIVTSSTYRQSSMVTKDHLAKDPENRYLARGPRLRLQAEFIRDNALAISGLLNRRIGGPSVSPYQPAGLWQELASRGDSKNWSAQFFVQSQGIDLYRRSMYTFWKRTSPPPQMVTFDAPDRETCTVRRSRTNTPLQALILMNDPTYVEASRKLAERLLAEAKTTEERIALGFRLSTGRNPSEKETGVLRKIFEKQLQRYQADSAAAIKLLSVGESGRDERWNPSELAAWSIVSTVILNLDETITKN